MEDALRIIRELQDGTLDDVIRIHEDLCTVVFSTVSAYSVWFVIHWFTYAAGVLLFIIWVSTEVEQLLRNGIGIPTVVLVYDGVILVCLVYLFLLPCVCAARITSGCAGKVKINRRYIYFFMQPTYPWPKPISSLASRLGQNVVLGEG